MWVERTDKGTFLLTDGQGSIELSRDRYEDIYYALPLETGLLFRLLNDTVLQTPAERETLKQMIERAGGLENALGVLQESLKQLRP
jgi:hypothetical protein